MNQRKPITLESPFSTEELARWKARLLEIRQQMLLDAEQLSAESDIAVPSQRDVSESVSGREIALTTTSEAHQTVALIDQAIAKITSQQPVPFGICEETRQPIEQDRLELMPWTPVSSVGAQLREGFQARV